MSDRVEGKKRRRRRKGGLGRALRMIGASAQNAAEIMRIGRLGAPYAAEYDVVIEERCFRLRHYRSPADPGWEAPAESERLRPLLLVPPLMVTSEVYDIAPDLSAVAMLARAGLDVWLIDFGRPEEEPGGMDRTLDDHVRGVSTCVDEILRRTELGGVHLLGYSQGGMFCYQVAAWRRSEGIASVVTFGSPVDIRRNVPLVSSARAAERVIAATRKAIEIPLEKIDGLPGFLTSTGFKLLSVRKEVEQIADFVRKLHDRQALERRESRRRFLGGEGFVAWPGPALRKFIDEFIVHNRMASGGFVIAGQTVTLADITCPILYFVGENDEIALPASVRSIVDAAPAARAHEIGVRAGHFGLVVGSKAAARTWPAVIEWARHLDLGAAAPVPPVDVVRRREEAAGETEIDDIDDTAWDDAPLDLEVFWDIASGAFEGIARRARDVAEDAGELIDSLRFQVPRLAKLRQVEPDTRINVGLTLAEQAAAIPDATFFLWKGRAFTYRDADRRVENVVRGLLHCGVRKGSRVGVLMDTRPSYLSIVTALNRMGAVSVLLHPDSTRVTLDHAVAAAKMDALVTDPDHAARAREAFDGAVLSLGGGPAPESGTRERLPEGVIDMEAIDPAAVALPSWYEPNAGRAADLAMIIFTAGRAESPKPARITNRRWAFSALGAAAGCTLTSDDTVYCCLPLHHAAGMLVAVGGAIVGGSRLALAKRFDALTFFPEVRRYGASVVFYAGDMLRELVEMPESPLEARSPVRLFAGSGMRADVWERLSARFGRASVLEFYASTEGNAVLANAAGEKIGSIGRPLPGSTDLALLAWDHGASDFARDEQKQLIVAATDAPGVLVARIDPTHPMAGFDGYVEEGDSQRRVLRSVFESGDAYFVTGDLLRRDADGDYWFVDRLSDVVRTSAGPITTIAIDDALCRLPGVRQAISYGVSVAGETVLAAAIVPRGELDVARFSRALAEALPMARRPRYVRLVDRIPLTDGFRPFKAPLRAEGIAGHMRVLRLDVDGATYVREPIGEPPAARA